MLLRHNIDRLGRASSASNRSGSCASILTLHTLVGAGVVRTKLEARAHRERLSEFDRGLKRRTATQPQNAPLKSRRQPLAR